MVNRRCFLWCQAPTAPDFAVQRLRGKAGTGGERGDFENTSGEFQIGNGEGFWDWTACFHVGRGGELDCLFQLITGSTGAFGQGGESGPGGRGGDPFAVFFAPVKVDGIVWGLHDESEVVGFNRFFHMAELVGLRLSIFFLKVEGRNFQAGVCENVMAYASAGMMPAAMAGQQTGIGKGPIGDISFE